LSGGPLKGIKSIPEAYILLNNPLTSSDKRLCCAKITSLAAGNSLWLPQQCASTKGWMYWLKETGFPQLEKSVGPLSFAH